MAYPDGFSLKDERNLDFLDFINVIAFFIGLENLKLNATANDLDRYAHMILDEIHGHLAEQDKRLDTLETELNGVLNGKNRRTKNEQV